MQVFVCEIIVVVILFIIDFYCGSGGIVYVQFGVDTVLGFSI